MPFIDIYDGTYTGSGTTQQGNVYMSAGYELFSYKNNVDNNTLILTDNVTYQIDKHNFTFGLSFEHQYFQTAISARELPITGSRTLIHSRDI